MSEEVKTTTTRSPAPSMTVRARRRREEAVRRLVADLQKGSHHAATTALEKGLDRELHTELVQETKDNAARIGQICHDHADVFLDSVAQVAALQAPSAALSHGLEQAHRALTDTTAGPMLHAAKAWDEAAQAHARALNLAQVVHACQQVAVQLEQSSQTDNPKAALQAVQAARHALQDLKGTPFGQRAEQMLPKLEAQVLQSAKRHLSRWLVQLRQDASLGQYLLWQAAASRTLEPYLWQAKRTDNWLSRLGQNGKVARAVRQGYWFERDATKEAERATNPSEAIAAAFGYYRCWPLSNDPLLVDPVDYANVAAGNDSGSRHGTGGLSGSRHGLRSSRHGKGRTLGFRATTSSRSQTFQELSSNLGTNVATINKGKSPWEELLTASVLWEGKPSAETWKALPESVHPVRRAELAFGLLGRSDEFLAYYEQNRFGETVIGDDRKSALSALTGDDVSVPTDRTFFAKVFPNLCASVVSFSAVEATLELGNFDDEDEEDAKTASTLGGTRFRESSERYERALISELGSLMRSRALRSNLGELVRSSSLLSVVRAALKVVHPSSTSRRHDKDLLALDVDLLMSALKIAQDEQLKCTAAVAMDDRKLPLLVADSVMAMKGTPSNKSNAAKGIPDPEELGLPFGLSFMKQVPPKTELEEPSTSSRASTEEAFTFSPSVPVVVRALHARIITFAAFALSQEELGQKFPTKKGSGAAGFVLDGLEQCVNMAAVGLKDSENVVEEGSVDKAVQVMANIAALQHCLPRLFGTVMRGLCHVGLIRAEEIDETFAYAEKTLKAADKACDAQVGSTYSLVYEICRNKIDSHINYALENYNWVAKTARDMPNAYCEGLIGYMRTVFSSLGPMDEGSRAGLHFSCCGHVSERLVKLLSGKPGDTAMFDDSGIPPITRIDAFGIKNLQTDCEELEKFADSTGVPQLRDCFSEFRVLTTVMLDKELPVLLLAENAGARRRKYPILSLEKVLNILEKYQGTGLGDKLMGGARGKTDVLFIDKKEVTQLIKIVKAQVIQ